MVGSAVLFSGWSKLDSFCTLARSSTGFRGQSERCARRRLCPQDITSPVPIAAGVSIAEGRLRKRALRSVAPHDRYGRSCGASRSGHSAAVHFLSGMQGTQCCMQSCQSITLFKSYRMGTHRFSSIFRRPVRLRGHESGMRLRQYVFANAAVIYVSARAIKKAFLPRRDSKERYVYVCSTG